MRILIIGGLDQQGKASASVDIYDPRADTACRVGDLQRGRWLASAVGLSDGRVLVAGGLSGDDPGVPTAEAEMLDPRFVEIGSDCGQISGELAIYRVPDTRYSRYAASSYLLPNETVALTGGLDENQLPIKQIEVFVPDE